MEEEAAEELDSVEGESFFDAPVAVILPAEVDAAVYDLEQAMIGDGDAVSVAAEIVDDLGGAAEGALGVDDPALMGGRPQPTTKRLWVRESGQIAKEREMSLLEGFEQGLTKEMAEAGAEDFDREEEMLAVFLGTTARDPALAVGRQTSTRYDAMQVRVMS